MSVHNGARAFLLNETVAAGIEASQRAALQSTQACNSLRNGGQCSRLTASLRQNGRSNIWNGRESSSSCELQAILQNSSAGFNPQVVSCFGVSPPVRSGAANPIGHDASFNRDAGSACFRSLQALKELESASAGPPFLREDLWCRGSIPVNPPLTMESPQETAGARRGNVSCNPMSPFTCRVEYFAV